MVSIPGGEPLMHPQIVEIVEGLIARKKVHLSVHERACWLKEKIGLFKPSKYLTFSVHLDGQREHHDLSVCREGGYDQAVAGIREAVCPWVPRHDQHKHCSTARTRIACAPSSMR